MMNKNILCVDDDVEIRNIIRASLPPEISMEEAEDVKSAIQKIETQQFEIFLIDLNLKNESGFELIEYVKNKEFATVPKVMIVTASDVDADEIRGHQLEVTEYIHKPLRPSVFRALIEKHLNKATEASQVKKVGPLKVNTGKMQVKIQNENEVEEDLLLTLKEYKLLMKFLDHPNKSFTREQLYVEVWDTSSEIQSRTIDMHVSALRKKLGNYGNSISSIRGVGYLFDPAKMSVA